MSTIKDELSAIEQKINSAKREQAKAEARRDSAKAELKRALAEAQEKFGVKKLDELVEMEKSLQARLDEKMVELREATSDL